MKPWTILVYMQADNDLAPYAYWDLREMETIGSTAKADVVVQLDLPGDEGLRRLHIEENPDKYHRRQGIEHYRQSTPADLKSTVLETLSETDGMSEASRFEAFLDWGIRAFPSEHQMVIVWGHALGWAGIALKDQAGESARRIQIPELHEAMKAVSARLLQGRPIDVYASDACLMQTLEVATELSDVARFVVGSSRIENLQGLPYRRFLHDLNRGRMSRDDQAGISDLAIDEARGIARRLPLLYRKSVRDRADARFIAMSSIDTQVLETALLPALKALSQSISAYFEEDPIRTEDALAALQRAPSIEGGTQELSDFLGVLKAIANRELTAAPESAAVKSLIGASGLVTKALDETVISHALGSELAQSSPDSRSVSLWVPANDQDYQARIDSYGESRFYRFTGWQDWLVGLYLASDTITEP